MADRKRFENSIVPLPEEGFHPALGLIVNAAALPHPDESLTLHFSLALPDSKAEAMGSRIARGEVIPVEEQDRDYAVNPDDVRRLEAWLSAEGFAIQEVTRDGIYARAPSSTIAKSLEVNMVPVTHNGFTNMAARDAPSLPSDIAESVSAIGGLQPFLRAHRHSRMRSPSGGNRARRGASVFGLVANAADNPFQPPYLTSEIRKAYGMDGIAATGAGQIIAILIDTIPNPDDLAAFWQENNLPAPPRIEVVNVRGGALDAPEGEETLDACWSGGIATGATIRIYASGSLAFIDLDRALDRIIADLPRSPGLRQLSISLGLGEQYMSNGEVATQHQKYLRLAAAGVNVFVSTGDAGSNPDQTGHSPSGPQQAEYPASDSAVIAVGGTSLSMSSAGSVTDEVGWTGSGGGVSRFFDRPAWQDGGNGKRMVPDVSLAADPNTGALLILNGRATQMGGTSWSAPVWAGLCALANELRHQQGKPPLPFLSPLLYRQAGTNAFRDIVAGSNGAFACGPGYDNVTGLGAPDAARLIAALP
jgi:kumamolisin